VEASLAFIDSQGVLLTEMRIVTKASDAGAIQVVDASEAAEFGEEQIQLMEGKTYQYELRHAGFAVEPIPSIIQPFMVGAEDRDRGILSPGLYVGSLKFRLLKDGERCGAAQVEVRSRKLTFRTDYRKMLDDIASISLDLLLSLFSPSSLDIEMDLSQDNETLQQRFFFLRALADSDDFRAAIHQIVTRPHIRLVSTTEVRSVARSGRGGAQFVRQIASVHPRQVLSSSHPLSSRLPSIPRDIVSDAVIETHDTPENRFVLFVLDQFVETLTTMSTTLLERGAAATHFVSREIDPILQRLEDHRSHSVFQDLSRLSELPLGSPVLQRKEGYRQILEAWLRFNAAGRLSWGGISDVASAGSRNAAALYEYWLFFVLLKALEPWIGLDRRKIIASVLAPTSNGFGLMVKSGQVLPLPGVAFEHRGIGLKLQFAYNRTFSEGTPTPVARRLTSMDTGSAETWTRKMRPDFTLSIWPIEYDQDMAAVNGSLTHLHFDAKYSVDEIKELFGDPSLDIEEEKENQRGGTYTRGDLLKMHAYKDAIRRSSGAYVLYPGQGAGHRNYLWQQYHEVIPGLGAFSVRPDDFDTGSETIRSFVSDILDELTARSSQMPVP
jgi:predicted component of viral defense system (DUF524 family)